MAGNYEKCLSQRPTESDFVGNCEKCLSQRPTESDFVGNCEKYLSQRPTESDFVGNCEKCFVPEAPLSLTRGVTVRNVLSLRPNN